MSVIKPENQLHSQYLFCSNVLIYEYGALECCSLDTSNGTSRCSDATRHVIFPLHHPLALRASLFPLHAKEVCPPKTHGLCRKCFGRLEPVLCVWVQVTSTVAHGGPALRRVPQTAPPRPLSPEVLRRGLPWRLSASQTAKDAGLHEGLRRFPLSLLPPRRSSRVTACSLSCSSVTVPQMS